MCLWHPWRLFDRHSGDLRPEVYVLIFLTSRNQRTLYQTPIRSTITVNLLKTLLTPRQFLFFHRNCSFVIMPKNIANSSSKGQGRRPQSSVDMIYKELTAPENRSVVYSIAMFTVSHFIFFAYLGRDCSTRVGCGTVKRNEQRAEEDLGATSRISGGAVGSASEIMMHKPLE